MSTLIQFDFTPLFDENLNYWVPHKSSEQELKSIKARFTEWITPPYKSPIYSGYRRQILEGEGLTESLALAGKLREKFDRMVVLGIGGSALGTRAVLEAVGHHTEAPKPIEILDNLDPIVFEKLWKKIDPAKTVFTVISKSGGTLETMAQCALVIERLKAAGLDPADHLVAITDPESGALREWVTEGGIKESLSVPSDVGGRFSVLTPVGLLPLAFAGVDVSALIAGAQDYFKGKNFKTSHSLEEIAHRTNELESEGFNAHVLMPYASVLREFSSWFVQLWGESLGKESSKGLCRGSTPVAATGATDQHSLLQLLVEGPRRITTGFISVGDWSTEHSLDTKASKMPATLPAGFKKLGFAHGKSFGEILMAQSRATQSVLQKRSRPTYRIHLPQLREANLGALMAFFMDFTSMTGAAFDVNPYNQPGVEEGKVILPEYLK
ncbi:glucose-6-phosphate isomerase [bacterium]|nr:glucose-6-phosphate isomerase [bacterium]